jgi:hypothetical protein
MKKVWMSVALLAGLFLVVGCGKKPAEATGDKKDVAKADPKETPKAKPKDDSEEDGSWWCRPHGVPEDECSMCSAKAAKEFKAKGDWCEKHERAKSQCFICDPSLMEKAKAQYKAKTGEEMPLPKKNMPEKK